MSSRASTSFKTLLLAGFVVALANAFTQSSPSVAAQGLSPQIVDLPSGTLHLKGYFWKPAGTGPFPAVLFNHGSGAADAQHTAGQTMGEAAANLAPLFLKHGYAFFYLCRRGQGLSADQAPSCKTFFSVRSRPKGKRLVNGYTTNL
jgi:hypothetical protein